MVIGGTAVCSNVAANVVGLYALTGVNGVADVMVMSDGVLTIANGHEFCVTGGPGGWTRDWRRALIEFGADSVPVDLLVPGPNLDTHAEVI